MVSRTSFFNKTIFRDTLRRYWAVFAVYALVLIVTIPLDMVLTNKAANQEIYFYVTEFPIMKAWHSGLILSFVMAAVVVMFLFGYLYSGRQSALYASLPVTRSSLFCTQVCAALTGLLAADAVTAVILLFAEGILGNIDLLVISKFLAILILMNLVFFGFALFCGMLTGSIYIMPLVYGALSVAGYGFSVLIGQLATKLVFGYEFSESPFMYLSPIPVLLRNGPDRYYPYMELYGPVTVPWRTLMIYAVVGVLFLVLAWYLYQKRRAETVNDTVSFPILKPLFRICMALGFALLLSLGSDLMYGIDAGTFAIFPRILILTVLGGILGYYLAEAIIRKSFRVVSRQALARCGILTCLLAVMVIGLQYDWFHLARIPSAEKILSIEVNYMAETPLHGSEVDQISITDPKTIELCREAHQSIMDHKKIHRNAGEENGRMLFLDYVLKNGRVLHRSYYLDTTTEEGKADCEWVGEVINSSSTLQSRKESLMKLLQDPNLTGDIEYYLSETEETQRYQLSTDQLQDLVTNCILPDLEESTILNYYLDSEEYYRDVYTWEIALSVEIMPNDYHYAYISVPVDAVRCTQWIQHNLGLSPITITDANALDG